MHSKIIDIQKSFERAYTDFYRTGDMARYNSDLDTLFKKYQDDELILSFCRSLLIAWAPIVNAIKSYPEKRSRIKIIKR